MLYSVIVSVEYSESEAGEDEGMAGSGDIERARFFFYILIFISIKIPVLLQSIFSTSPSEKHGTYSIYILQWTQVTVTLSSVCIYALQSIVLYS